MELKGRCNWLRDYFYMRVVDLPNEFSGNFDDGQSPSAARSCHLTEVEWGHSNQDDRCALFSLSVYWFCCTPVPLFVTKQ